MAIKHIQDATIGKNGSGTTQSAGAFATNPTVGNYVVVSAWFWNLSNAFTTANTTISDNIGGNTWTNAGFLNTTPGVRFAVGIWYAKIANTGASFTVTVTTTVTSSTLLITASEFSGIAASNPVDGSAVSNTGTLPSSGSANITIGNMPITPGDLVVAVLNVNASGGNTVTIGTPSGWTQTDTAIDDDSNDAAENFQYGQAIYNITTTSGPSNPSWTLSTISQANAWNNIQVAFLPTQGATQTQTVTIKPTVQQVLGASSVTGALSLQSSAMASPLTSPSSILVFIWYEGSTNTPTVTVTDLAGNTYTRDITTQANTEANPTAIWRAQNTKTTAGNKVTVTLTGSAGSTNISFCVMEVIPPVFPVGSGSTNHAGSGSTLTTGTVNFSANNLVVATVAAASLNGTLHYPAGYSLVGSSVSSGSVEDGSANYIIHSAAGSENPTWTITAAGDWSAIAQAYAATATQFQEAGSNATGDLSFYTSTTGSVTSDTGVSRSTDPRSINCTCDASGNPSYAQQNTIVNDAGVRSSAYFYFDNLPDNGNDSGSGRCFLTTINSSANNVIVLSIRSTGILAISGALNASGGGTFKAGTTVISSATWNRITVSYTITSVSSWSAKVYLNGNLEISASNTDFSLSNTGSVNWQAGWITGVIVGMANKVMHFADVYVDNGADLNDVCLSGYQRGVTDKKAITVFQNNWDTVIGTGSLTGVPISTTNGVEELNSKGALQTYKLEALSVGDRNISPAAYKIISHSGWIYAQQTTTGSGLVKLVENNGEYDISVGNAPTVYIIINDTSYGVQNEIGMRDNGVNQGTFLYGAGAVVTYDAPTNPMTAIIFVTT